MSEFTDCAAFPVTLRFGGQSHAIAGGDVKQLKLKLTPYGFTGSLELNVLDTKRYGGDEQDLLYADFITDALGEVELTVQAVVTDTVTVRPPLVLKGLVQERTLHEQQFGVESNMTMVRRYSITFADPARVLWSQHHPCQLYTNQTFRDVVEANLGQYIHFRYDWSQLTTRYDVLFLALDPHIGDASFYDYVWFYVDRHRGYLTYDPGSNTYLLSGQKEDAAAPLTVYPQDVALARHGLAPVPRANGRVLNSFTPSAGVQLHQQPAAVDGVVCDTLLCTPFDSELAQRGGQLSSRLQAPAPALTLELSRFPAVPLFAGDLVDFTTAQWPPDSWLVQQQSFRVVEVDLSAGAHDDDCGVDHRNDYGQYDFDITVELEQKSDPTPQVPDFEEPETPVYVEGKIVSTVGQDGDRTHEPFTDAQTGMLIYKVLIPLFGQVVVASYKPGNMPGQLYFPLHRDQRVQLAMTWRQALIVGCVDWREDVATPTPNQGNHLLLGKKGGESCTSLLHYYQSPDEPRFKVARTNTAQSGSGTPDCQTLEMAEGVMTITVGQAAEPAPYIAAPDEVET